MGTRYIYTCGCRDPQPLMIGTDRQTAKICSDTWAAMQAGKGACLIFDIWSDSKAALGELPVAGRNRRGFSAEKESHRLRHERNLFCLQGQERFFLHLGKKSE